MNTKNQPITPPKKPALCTIIVINWKSQNAGSWSTMPVLGVHTLKAKKSLEP